MLFGLAHLDLEALSQTRLPTLTGMLRQAA
jgi:hypothetical protein